MILDPGQAGFEAFAVANESRRTGLSCLLARAFAAAARRRGRGAGSGRSGEIRMVDPGQTVLAHTAVLVDAEGGVEARFTVGLPAAGRRILGRAAQRLLLETLPGLVRETLVASAHPPDRVRRHVQVNEDADHLRRQLEPRGLVAFVADGAVLPRRSGVDDRPLVGEATTPFASPPSLRVELDRIHGPPVAGMGVERGVTLLVGGGYHGKSTVLDAIARGVYNHRPGDGRERVVADSTATKVQAEDGRSVTGVDVSAFIGRLPGGRETSSFTTRNASGSTSQAAAVVEALEAGSKLLLIDEDTAATNFMIRDRRMQALIRGDDEPITPFIDRVRDLRRAAGVSAILVVGGSGDYFDVADRVVAMARYRPRDVTEAARRIARDHPTGREGAADAARWPRRRRIVDPRSIDPGRGRRRIFVRVRARDRVAFGRDDLDLAGVPQIVLEAQTRAIARALAHARKYMDGKAVVEDVLAALEGCLRRRGLDALDPELAGDLAMPRVQDVAAALGRLRTLALIDGSGPRSQFADTSQRG